MRRVSLIVILLLFSQVQFGQIIADHSVVDLYSEIPQRWIDTVKTKWISITGASHAGAYHRGLQQLQSINNKYPVRTQYSGAPNPFQTTALRSSGATLGSYESATGWNYILDRGDWWTNDIAVGRIKNYLQYCNDVGPKLFATMYGWSYDANFDHEDGNGPRGDYDPVYHTRWAGSSLNGKDGNRVWGLDSEDSVLTNNGVSMSNYIESINEYIKYCTINNISTKLIFATGPVEDNGTQGWNINEKGYQQYLKWKYIRDYVAGKSGLYFMDYADILSYNDAGVQMTTSWIDNNSTLQTFPMIHPDNMGGDAIGHIGTVGALRLGKAMWWLLARMSGWDGNAGNTDTTPPTQPANLELTPTSQTSVTLSWSASTDNTGVTGYRIYRSGSLLSTTTGLTYTDNTVVTCTSYNYTVSAIDAANNESSQSTAASLNASIPAPEATLTQPSCSVFTGTIQITAPVGTGFEYSINSGTTWGSGTNFALLPANATYTISARNTIASPGCISNSNFVINPIPASPLAPTVSSSSPVNVCPALTINLTTLVTSTTPSGGSILYKAANNPLSLNVPNPAAVGAGTYYIFYQNQTGCYSAGTPVIVTINSCTDPDVTPTLIVNPNIIHGVTSFDLTVRITELNLVNTNGIMTVHIPKDPRWIIEGGYNPSLTSIGGTALNNSAWSYSSDDINHIFTSSATVPQGGYSMFGFKVTFNPDLSRGIYTITSQLVSGAGGEVRVSNNADSERIDYFQE